MKIELTEEQEMLRASARDFLEKECTETVIKAVEVRGLGYSPELWAKIADLGWCGLVFPPRYGGSGMEIADLAVLCEELGRAMFPAPFVSTVVIAGLTILEAGTDEQKTSLIPALIQGKQLVCMVLNEAGPRSVGRLDPQSVSVRFSPHGDGFVLNGQTVFVTSANTTSAFLVPARHDGEEDITLFWVDPPAQGMTVTPLASLAGDCPCEIVFHDVRVSRQQVIGSIGSGLAPLTTAVNVGNIMMAAQMLGSGEKLLRAVTEDYETRIQSNAAAQDENTAQYMARLRQELDDCRTMVYEQVKSLPMIAGAS